MTDIHELSKHLNIHADWPELPDREKIYFLALGLCGEAGEIANELKKDWRGDFRHANPKELKDRLIKEIADVCNYAFMLAAMLGLQIEDVLQSMLDKLIEVEQRSAFIEREGA